MVSTRYSCHISTETDFFYRFSKTQLSNFIKIRHVGDQFFHADIRTNGHDEASSRLSKFREGA